MVKRLWVQTQQVAHQQDTALPAASVDPQSGLKVLIYFNKFVAEFLKAPHFNVGPNHKGTRGRFH